ncbi:MAG: ABC transporter permease [Desulfatibacillaceae bacterium]
MEQAMEAAQRGEGAARGPAGGRVPGIVLAVADRKRLLPLGAFAVLLSVWELAVLAGGYSPDQFPGPFAVLDALVELASGGVLAAHAVASLFRVTAGFYLAVLLGVPAGILLGWWNPGKQMFNPVLQFLRPISPLAWIPLALLWFGIGDPPALFLIFLSSFFPIVLSTSVAVEGIAPTYFHVAANFAFTRREVVSRVIVPAILPEVVTALRISLGVAWLVVVAAEMIAVKSGLGYLIIDSRNALRMDYVMAAMAVIGCIGLVLDGIMRRLSRIPSVSWARSGR